MAMTKTKKQEIEKLLAKAYGSLAHVEYNLAGSQDTAPLRAFRRALYLLELDVNRYLPSGCEKV